MKPVILKACGTCKFFRLIDKGAGEGKCRRFPPCLMPTSGGGPNEFPVTDTSDWCGEWEWNVRGNKRI